MDDAELLSWLRHQIGPRQVGGRYHGYYWDEPYEVVDLQIRWGTDGGCQWSISVRGQDGSTRTHCTPWDHRRDTVLSQPSQSAGARSQLAVAMTRPNSEVPAPHQPSQPRVDS